MTFVVNAEVALWNAGRYLVARRSDREPHAAGLLGFIGGVVENHPVLGR